MGYYKTGMSENARSLLYELKMPDRQFLWRLFLLFGGFMKRFIFVFCTIFICGVAFAKTIRWHVGDSVYTTTCNSGDSVVMPIAPTKTGYSFQKWRMGYNRVEYLELQNAGPVIDTGYIPSNLTQIKIKVQFTNIEKGYLFGVYPDGNHESKQSYEFFIWNTATQVYYSGARWIPSKIQAGNIVELDWNKNILRLSINNVVSTNTFAASAFTLPYSLPLFALRSSNTFPASGAFQGKIYYFQIYDNDVLVRDMIPVVDSNGVACMYDKVTNEFFYNQGTGDFIAGPVVSE